MAKLLTFLLSTGLCFSVGLGVTGCSKTPETDKNESRRTRASNKPDDSKKPGIVLSAKDVEIEVEVDKQNVTKEDAKGAVPVLAKRRNMNDAQEIAVTFDALGLPKGVKIEDTKVKAKENEAKATILVPKGTKVDIVTPDSSWLATERPVFVTGAAGDVKTETQFKLTLKRKKA